MGYQIKAADRTGLTLMKVNTGLDGVVDQRHNYKKSKFKLAYRNIRYELINRDINDATIEPIFSLKEIHMDELLQYDHRFFPCHRNLFLKNWLAMPNAASKIYIE